MQHSDSFTRRGLIQLLSMPQPRHDAVVVMSAPVAHGTVRLRYVPDRYLIDPETFATYLESLPLTLQDHVLVWAQMILEDVNDQVIPCWLEVKLDRAVDMKPVEQAIIEDKQPRWQDPGILGRLEP